MRQRPACVLNYACTLIYCRDNNATFSIVEGRDLRYNRSSSHTMGSDKYRLKWSKYENNILDAFRSLLETEALSDVTLFCEGIFKRLSSLRRFRNPNVLGFCRSNLQSSSLGFSGLFHTFRQPFQSCAGQCTDTLAIIRHFGRNQSGRSASPAAIHVPRRSLLASGSNQQRPPNGRSSANQRTHPSP